MRFSFKTLAAVGAAALMLSACGSGSTPAETTSAPAPDSTSAAAPAEGGTIYLVSKGFQHRFWQAVKEGAEQAGEEFGYTIEFVGPDNEKAVTQQLDQLTTALNTKPAAIGFAALDSGAAEPVLQQIKDAGIPVIAFDSGVDSDIPLTTVQTDNKAAAAEAAKRMSEALGGKGTVGLVCHDQTSQTGKERCSGFQEWMAENAPEITVLQEQYAGEVGLAANAAKSMLDANPEISGMYGSNEAAAIGVVQGVKEAGKDGSVTIVGFDSGKAQLDAVRDGTVYGSVTQSPVKIGYETVKAAIAAINGEELPKIIDSGFAWYTAENMDDPEIAANLYE